MCVYFFCTHPGSTSTFHGKKQMEWLTKYYDEIPGENDQKFLLNPKNLKDHFDIIRMISNHLKNKFIALYKLSKINATNRTNGDNFVRFYHWVHKFDLINCYMKLRDTKFSNFDSKNLSLKEIVANSFEDDHNKAMQQICNLNNIQQPWVEMPIHSQGSETITPSITPPIEEICSTSSPSKSPTNSPRR